MKEIKINLPIDREIGNVSAKIENGCIVVMCEPKKEKKEFKYGDFVRSIVSKVGNGNDMVEHIIGIIREVHSDMVYILSTDGCSYYCDKALTDEARDFEKIDIQHYLDENNLVIDYEKKKIVKKRWRAEKDETFYCVTSCGIVLETRETYNEDDNMLFNSGNYFQTKEQAEKVAKEVREVFEKHKND